MLQPRLEALLTWEKLGLAWHLVEQARPNTVYIKQSALSQSDLEPWQLLLEILLVEDRTFEVQRLGWEAYNYMRPDARRELLRTLTVGLLADLPDEQIRTTLRRWTDADPDDVNAQIALWQRILLQPRATDPDRPSILAALEALLTNHPSYLNAREALITALADAGRGGPRTGLTRLLARIDARRSLLAPPRSMVS